MSNGNHSLLRQFAAQAVHRRISGSPYPRYAVFGDIGWRMGRAQLSCCRYRPIRSRGSRDSRLVSMRRPVAMRLLRFASENPFLQITVSRIAAVIA